MLTVGDKFPTFSLTAVNGTDPKTAFTPASNDTYAGKWLVVFAWPKDFTFVCPTEIFGFDDIGREFRDRDAQLLRLSIHSEVGPFPWRHSRPHLAKVASPWLSGTHPALSAPPSI